MFHALLLIFSASYGNSQELPNANMKPIYLCLIARKQSQETTPVFQIWCDERGPTHSCMWSDELQ